MHSFSHIFLAVLDFPMFSEVKIVYIHTTHRGLVFVYTLYLGHLFAQKNSLV